MIAVVLAAGKSERFGQCKQIYPIDGKPMILHVLDAIPNHMQTYVVLGGHRELIRPILPQNVSILINNEFELGIGTSVQMAVNKAVELEQSLLITTADLPFILRSDYEKLLDEKSDKAVFSSFGEAHGPPCTIPYSVLRDIAPVAHTSGLKKIIKDYSTIEISSAARDVDFITDLN